MIGFTVNTPPNGAGSPNATLTSAEIDTRAPFQSVKAAVSLFGEVSPKATTPVKKSKAEERVLEKETQHHMMLRERGYYTCQLRSAETAKAQALSELQRANRTLQQLTNKLDALSESKQASIRATEAAKIRAKELEEQRSRGAWKLEVNNERERCKATTNELTASKQELADLKQDFDAALREKLAVFRKAEEAQQKMRTSQERQRQLLKEVDELRQTLDQVKRASLQAQEDYSKIIKEKEETLMNHKLAKEETEKEIKRLREEYEPTETLQEKLEETMESIKVLQEQLSDVQSSDLYAIRKMASQLDNAKKTLEEAVAEENSLRSGVDSFKLQAEEVKKERLESEEKAIKAESTVEQMQADLEKWKAELEASVSGRSSFMQSSIEKLLGEAEKAKHEAEDCKSNAELLEQEAEAARTMSAEAEEKLKIALKEAEAAKAAISLADEKVYNYSTSEAAKLQGSGSLRTIRLSVEELESMNKKIAELRNQADIKVATATAQVEAINANEKGISEKLEVINKENEAIQSQIDDALKKAEMADAAKRIVESELQKWRQNEQRALGRPSKAK